MPDYIPLASSKRNAQNPPIPETRRRFETDPEAWRKPDMRHLRTGNEGVPAFPLEALGPFWASWVAEQADGVNAPADYVAVALLACTGSLLANVRWPVAGAGWAEPPILNAAAVGDPSSGKSPSVDAVLGLLRWAETEMSAGFEDDLRRHQEAKAAAHFVHEKWEKDLKSAIDKGLSRPSMPDEATEPVSPVRPRVVISDTTIERLAYIAAQLPRGLLLVRDELSGWLGSFDRYGGAGGDRAFWLEAYGGRSYTIDRVKLGNPITVQHLSIGVLGGIQPDRVGLVTKSADDGLASRFLWCWPSNKLPFKIRTERVDNQPAQDAFIRLARLRQGADMDGTPYPIRVPLTQPATAILEALGQQMKDREGEVGSLMRGTMGKARGHCLRLSMIIEMLHWAPTKGAEPTTISKEAMAHAANLIEGYFCPMAERVYGDAALSVPDRLAVRVIRRLRGGNERRFNARELRLAMGGELQDSANMNTALERLCEAGLIRIAAGAQPPNGGRPRLDFEVNQSVFGGSK